MPNRFAKLRKIRNEALALWDESALRSQAPLTRLHKFFHFWVLVWKSFTKNRCPVRASALAYVTLLALIPMLAVVMSITSSFLKKEGETQIDHFIVRMVASLTPPGVLSPTNAPASSTNTLATEEASPSTVGSQTNSTSVSEADNSDQAVNVKARKAIARNINEFIQNTRSGTLGVTGAVLLIFAAIGLLSRIEDTMNDIWGVARGRSWYMRIINYWFVISLVPMLLVVALGLATGPHLDRTKKLLTTMPWLANLAFGLLPVVLLCLTFAAFYMLMPNTKVRWWAALVGGIIAGVLFHLNNLVSVLYVSRVVSNFRIYGSLGLVPVFMMGLYFSWLIVLFGAQLAYAFQNRATYLEEKQVESVNQRGREFIALRLMTSIGQHFLRGEPPPGVVEIGRELCVPTRLIEQTMHTLCSARLVIETAGSEPSFVPARPLEHITCHDILIAMRSTNGQDLETRDEPVRNEVFGEFNRIQEAERQAAQSVTMLALASRAEAKQLPENGSNGEQE